MKTATFWECGGVQAPPHLRSARPFLGEKRKRSLPSALCWRYFMPQQLKCTCSICCRLGKRSSRPAAVSGCVLAEECLFHPSTIPPSLLLGWRPVGDHLPLHRRAPSACPQAPAICGPVVPATSAPMETGGSCSRLFAENEPQM